MGLEENGSKVSTRMIHKGWGIKGKRSVEEKTMLASQGRFFRSDCVAGKSQPS